MRSLQHRVEALRARATEHENHLIDEYRFGKIGRREFMRRRRRRRHGAPGRGADRHGVRDAT